MDIDHMPRFRLCGIMGRALFAAGLSASIGAPASGQTSPRPIGNAVVDLSPPLPRPGGPSCTVTLFDRREFQGDEPLPLAYRPPADCPGPWRKVVLEADFDVTTGTQFDRSADLTLGGATLFLGTTMEPGDAYAPHWQVARDVTDYAALLRTPTDGRAILVNYLDKDHDAHVHWGARLVFYAGEAPRPDGVVLPVTAGLSRLDPQKPMVSRTIRFPRNLTSLAIDLFAIGQEREEFWYDCAPGNLAQRNIFGPPPCDAPYREVEVRIDGRLAGVRSVQPDIFTGGINPGLWRRVPALRALNLPPARVDLTPFAALLNDGQPHVIALAMPTAGTFFRVSGTLIGTVDPTRPVVTGALTANTLAPARIVTRQLRAPRGPGAIGTVQTIATRADRVEGYVDTPHGRVVTRVAYDLDQRLTNTRDTGVSSKRYAARQTMTVTTHGATPSRRRIAERDTLAIDIGVQPPLYGVRNGTQIAQASERTISGDGPDNGRTAQTLTTFAPSFSLFTAPLQTPNHVRVTSLVEHATGQRRDVEAVVTDDSVTYSDTAHPTANEAPVSSRGAAPERSSAASRSRHRPSIAGSHP